MTQINLCCKCGNRKKHITSICKICNTDPSKNINHMYESIILTDAFFETFKDCQNPESELTKISNELKKGIQFEACQDDVKIAKDIYEKMISTSLDLKIWIIILVLTSVIMTMIYFVLL